MDEIEEGVSPVHSEQERAEAPSAIPDKIPSVIPDDGDSRVDEPEQDEEPINDNEYTSSRGLEQQAGKRSYEELEEIVRSSEEDLRLLSVIRNDPDAVELINNHFRSKTSELSQPDMGNDNIPDPASENVSVAQLHKMVQSLHKQNQTLAAQLAVTQYRATNPEFDNPKIQEQIKKIYSTPGYEAMSLEDAFVLAKNRAGMTSDGGKAPTLKPTETTGASAPDLVNRQDTPSLQRKIDEQKTLEDAVKVSLQSDFAEQGFKLGDD